MVHHHKKVQCAEDFAAAVAPYKNTPELHKTTNCYSYALGINAAGFAVPGHLTKPEGRLYNYMARADYMRKLFKDDGLIEVGHADLADAHTQVIAVVIKEYFNGHVLKYHKDGTWSYQDGAGQPISNLDCDDKIITDPRNANMGFYDEFVGYFKLPETGIYYKANKQSPLF
ncbi:MAG: hypothetical protein NZ828_00545 [Alphaproteobacteria bacterium]|nr:hypothetical protein [Alphaproteobacteria bacterium]